MGFSECAARSFTAISIQNNAPALSGVYGLSNGREWVFIGETANIRTRLMEHLGESDTPLKSRKPTGFSYELCTPGTRVSRHDALVRQLGPFCNRRIGYEPSAARRLR